MIKNNQLDSLVASKKIKGYFLSQEMGPDNTTFERLVIVFHDGITLSLHSDAAAMDPVSSALIID